MIDNLNSNKFIFWSIWKTVFKDFNSYHDISEISKVKFSQSTLLYLNRVGMTNWNPWQPT